MASIDRIGVVYVLGAAHLDEQLRDSLFEQVPAAGDLMWSSRNWIVVPAKEAVRYYVIFYHPDPPPPAQPTEMVEGGSQGLHVDPWDAIEDAFDAMEAWQGINDTEGGPAAMMIPLWREPST